VRPLGSGGMGHVWLARDERSGLDVALKMVAREGKAAERAEREARAAAALRHPRCQRIYALARDSGHVYIAYEYVPGRTIRQALGARELDDRGAVEVAAQVLDALAHAHGRGIVHRDVKPSNVLLGESEEIDVRLLDFGLAQMEEFDTLTAIGDVPGTLAYVSPERLAGQTATAAADVWAVGVMLWEALTGRHPFRSTSAEGTCRRIRAGAPPIEALRPDLPAGLRKSLARALDLDPARRPAAEELAAELRRGPRKRSGRVIELDSRRSATRLTAPRLTSFRLPSFQLPSFGLPATALPEPGRLFALAGERGLPAVSAAAWTGWATSTLTFYPAGWPLGLTAASAAIGLVVPRAALAFAFTATFFPLANISLGLAIVFAAFAAIWIAVTWTDPRGNAVLVAGPLLGPIAGLALIPLLAQLARGPVRRGLQAAAAVLLAVVVAGFRHERLPFDGTLPPLGLGITGSGRPTAVAYALWRALAEHPVVLTELGALTAAAVALPYLRGRGPWAAAAGGSALLAATALLAPAASLGPLIAAAWLTAAGIAARA